jgi:hypothetical protein
VISRGEQDRRREKLDDDEIPWITKEFTGNGCRESLGRNDRAGWVRYANSSANLKILLLTS